MASSNTSVISSLRGIFVPLVTPVNESGAIDDARLCEQVDYVIDHGVDGILAFGSNSEFYMFEDEEMLEATKSILKRVAGRVPVVFGIGHIRTSRCVELAKRASDLGVDGLAVLQPMFIAPTQEALYNHFSTIAVAVAGTPVLIYNNPGRTGYAVSTDVIVRLAHDVQNIVGIKDSSGNITVIEELVRRCSDIPFAVFAGKDTIVFPALCCGADGAVCSTANLFPDLVCGIYDAFQTGDYRMSRERQYKLNPIRLSQDAASFPAATKDMANLMGMRVGPSILPTEATSGPALEGMKAALRDADYLS